jgi:hypothetical protein
VSLVCVHLRKEWRAQRAMLVAYLVMALVAMAIGLSMAPGRAWTEGFGAYALSLFVGVGVFGVSALAAPALVRSEFGGKGDQFVRRLPGALAPSFGGKLAFLALVSVLLPLVGLLAGQAFVAWMGGDWNALYAVSKADAGVVWHWPEPVWFCLGALLLTPWVWAVGTWLPGGRMAVLGAVLLVLVLGACVYAVLLRHPHLEHGLAWPRWLWTVPVSGVLVAAVSWIQGRRGGSVLRSAALGLGTTGVVLLPAVGWLAFRCHEYRHPDLSALHGLDVLGIAPDGRAVVALGAGREGWLRVAVHVDLSSGEARQVGGIDDSVSPRASEWRGMPWSLRARTWEIGRRDGAELCSLDLTTGEVSASAAELERTRPTSKAMPETTPFAAPGGRRAWIDGSSVFVEQESGGVRESTWPFAWPTWSSPAGHGIVVRQRAGKAYYDLTLGRERALPARSDVLFVRGHVLSQPEGKSDWLLAAPAGDERVCAPLHGFDALGLFDDDRVLFVRQRTRRSPRTALFLFAPASGELRELTLPVADALGLVRCLVPLYVHGALLPRDPTGRIWLHADGGRVWRLGDDLQFVPLPIDLFDQHDDRRRRRLLDWQRFPDVVAQHGDRIVRIDAETGRGESLFPRR